MASASFVFAKSNVPDREPVSFCVAIVIIELTVSSGTVMRDFHLSLPINETKQVGKQEDIQWTTESSNMIELRYFISQHIRQSVCILVPSKAGIRWVQQQACCCHTQGIICKIP